MHISSWNVLDKHVNQFVPGRFYTSTYFKLNIWICFRGSVWKFGCFRDFLLRKNLFNFSFALGVLSFLRGLFPWALGFMESRSLCTLLTSTAKEGTKRWIIDHFNVPISRCVLVGRGGSGTFGYWKVKLKLSSFCMQCIQSKKLLPHQSQSSLVRQSLWIPRKQDEHSTQSSRE